MINSTNYEAPHRVIFSSLLLLNGSRVSSGSIVSDYGLDDRAIGVRSPAGADDFSSILCVQTGSGAHPASCPMGTGGPFPGGKARPGRDADHSPPLVLRSWMSRSYVSSPPKRLHGVERDWFTFYFYCYLILLGTKHSPHYFVLWKLKSVFLPYMRDNGNYGKYTLLYLRLYNGSRSHRYNTLCCRGVWTKRVQCSPG
jgi:hypothetical protein